MGDIRRHTVVTSQNGCLKARTNHDGLAGSRWMEKKIRAMCGADG